MDHGGSPGSVRNTAFSSRPSNRYFGVTCETQAFQQVLDGYFEGEADAATERLL
jgi:hypothetical protein